MDSDPPPYAIHDVVLKGKTKSTGPSTTMSRTPPRYHGMDKKKPPQYSSPKSPPPIYDNDDVSRNENRFKPGYHAPPPYVKIVTKEDDESVDKIVTKEEEEDDDELRILRDVMKSEKEEEEAPGLQRPLLTRNPSYFTVTYTKPLTNAVAEAAKRARTRREGPRPSTRYTKTKRVDRLDPFPRYMTIEICTLSGRSLDIEISHDVKVRDLKRCISNAMMDWPVNRQRLFLKGVPLKYPNSTLRRNGIVGRNITLHVVKALRTDDAEVQELPEDMKARPERITAQSESYRCISCGSVPCPNSQPGHTCDICQSIPTTYRCPNPSCDFDVCDRCWEQGARIFIKMRKDITAVWTYHEGGRKGYRAFLAEDSRYLEMRYHTFLLSPTVAPSSINLQVAGVATYLIDFRTMTQMNVSSKRKRGLIRLPRDDTSPIPSQIKAEIGTFHEIFPNRTHHEIFLVMTACHGDFDSTCAFLAS